ncbi:MAG: NADH-quinone oxidoreductase subunit C [Candidatus Thorarchaeota archaeon]
MSTQSTMTPAEFVRRMLARCPDISVEKDGNRTVHMTVPPERIRDAVQGVADNLPHAFPESVFGVDLQEGKFELIYIFWSPTAKFLVQLRSQVEGEEPAIDSVCDIFPGLEGHERETHEMFGIDFTGHPDLRPLLLPDELVGKYPLRKSFQTDRSRLAESGLSTRPPRPAKEAEQK